MGNGWAAEILQRLTRHVYHDTEIPNAPIPTPKPPTPKLLSAMRSLVTTSHDYWQSRSELFLKQARLMASYEDDYVYNGTVNQYFPTYDSLSDAQLRGYFTWRTAVRRGQIERRGMSYASLYVYELLHLIGCRDAQDGYEKLDAFCTAYCALDPQMGRYISDWEDEFIIYYGLPPVLLAKNAAWEARRSMDDAILTLLHREERSKEEVMEAVCLLSSYRLERSKLYRTHTDETNTVVLRILERIVSYYEKHRQVSFFDDLIAAPQSTSVHLFSSAVFQPSGEEQDRIYRVHALRYYECVGGYWTLHSYERADRAAQRLGTLLRGVDAALRAHFGITAIQPPKLKKWQAKIIDEEITAFLAEQRAIEARRVHLDFSQLARIRADANVTQERLIVEEEEPPMMLVFETLPVVPPASAEDMQPVDPAIAEGAGDINGLDAAELRLLRTLLGGGDLAWVRAEGLLLSVLVDGVNEKLYDDFEDTVIVGDPPVIVADYRDDLTERYLNGSE
ncbi:MAG: TerB N-terminal domain-containing protein [Selenomonas massiliensis]